MALKIMVVTLVGRGGFKAEAVFDGEQLVIAKVQPLEQAGLFASWKKPLIQEVRERVAQGYVVLVEEKTDHIAQHATQYLLEDLNDDHDGAKRSNYFDALDWYYTLNGMGNVLFHPDCEKYNFGVSSEGGMVDRQNDDKGRSVYKVDWSRFRGGHRAVLLCVVAAMYEPLSERFLTSMFANDERAQDVPDPVSRFKTALLRHDQSKGEQIDQQRNAREEELKQ